MSEIVFPLVAAALIYLVILPLTALVARGLLAVLDVLEAGHALHRRWHVRYLVIVGSSALPLAWFISASLHQADSGAAAAVCTVLDVHEVCPEPGFLAVLLTVIAVVRACRLHARSWSSDRDDEAQLVLDRIRRLAVGELAPLRSRVVVCARTHAAVETIGVLRPRVVLRTSFAESLDDEALAATLRHELEHVRGFDPLRYLLLRWALDVNPAGNILLGNEVAQWVLGREAHCDRAAVRAGAEPTALAMALVKASRRCQAASAVTLGADGSGGLRLRVELLLAYAERAPHACCQRPTFGWLAAAMALAVVLPHGEDHTLLDVFHVVAERGSAALLGE